MEKTESGNSDEENALFVRKERIRLLHEMQYLVEQQLQAIELLGLDYDAQVRLHENVDQEIAALLAEVANLPVHY